jgi:hypothetical protein
MRMRIRNGTDAERNGYCGTERNGTDMGLKRGTERNGTERIWGENAERNGTDMGLKCGTERIWG